MNSFSHSDIYCLRGVQRQVVEHVFIEMGEPKDLAERWGVSVDSIKLHVQRARANLAKKQIELPDRRRKVRLKYRPRFGRHGL